MNFFLPVRVLARLFRRRFLEALYRVHHAGRLCFFGDDAPLTDATAFAEWLEPLRDCEWVVYAKRPFAGPAAVLAYLLRYTTPGGDLQASAQMLGSAREGRHQISLNRMSLS